MAPSCPTCEKTMEFTCGAYRRYTCEKCGSRTVKGTRWHCAEHEMDICPACGGEPAGAAAPAGASGRARSKSQWLPKLEGVVPTFQVRAFAHRVRDEWGLRLTKLLIAFVVLAPLLRMMEREQVIKAPKLNLGLRAMGSDLRSKFQEPPKEPEKPKKKPKGTEAEHERLQDKAASLHSEALEAQAAKHRAANEERELLRKMQSKYH